ncbi:hypothetical protein GCM10023158_01850 [Gluconacetobacter tumulicola]
MQAGAVCVLPGLGHVSDRGSGGGEGRGFDPLGRVVPGIARGFNRSVCAMCACIARTGRRAVFL